MDLKKVFIFALTALMCLGSFAACSDNGDNESVSDASDSTESENSETSEEVAMYPEYWGNGSYDTVENVGAPEPIESHKMKMTRLGEARYKIEYETEAGKFALTFDEKAWGTYNLAAWTLTDASGTTHVFASGSTDLEYVYRTSNTSSGGWVWSGGNHGNETLVSLAFYDGETEEEIKLTKNGESVKINKLHIIEKTKLLWQADTDGDGYGFKDKKSAFREDEIYAEVVRKYTIVGPQITLNVDQKYLKDTYHYLSYTCMFPMNKPYGNWCDMYDQAGNKLKTVETPKTGSNGTQHSGNAATRAVIYGHQDPRYRIDVRVNTSADSLDSLSNSFKTSYWDMNANANKLYFSKYDLNTPTKVAAGTEFHTECVWVFDYDKDAK